MPRKGPTTGAKPNREGHSHFAEDIWKWFKANQNVILLGMTIAVVGIVLLVIRSRSTRKTHNQAQEAVGSFFYDSQSKENLPKRVKRIQSRISRFQGVPKLVPWLRLQLASVYYQNGRYNDAADALQTLRKKHEGTQAADLAKTFLDDLRDEKSYMNKTIARKKQSLNERFERSKLVFDVSDKELSNLSEASSSSRPAPPSMNRP